MATNSVAVKHQIGSRIQSTVRATGLLNGAASLAGRALFSFLFIMSSLGHFSERTITYAASQGVPFASFTVPLSGLISLAGGLSILLGYRAQIGGWLIVLFLLPVTLMMHQFWVIADPTAAQLQQIMFWKNISLMGGALLIAQFGAGSLSLDARSGR